MSRPQGIGPGDRFRVRIDASKCDGQGVCGLVAPELFSFDRYGYAYLVDGVQDVLDADDSARRSAIEAEATCPRLAIVLEKLGPAPAAAGGAPVAPAATRPPVPADWSDDRRRLHVGDAVETLDDWKAAGGFGPVERERLWADAEAFGLRGQGGALFPVVSKWRQLDGARDAVVLVNAAEREPGTMKDRYLLAHRPFLFLDGVRLAALAVGATKAVVAVDEDHADIADGVRTALAAAGPVMDGVAVDVTLVPAKYVAGEETALIASVQGGPPLPKWRPPYPSTAGLNGKPTLVHNAETVCQIGLIGARGAAMEATTLFTVGPFGGPFDVVERPFGYSLAALLSECGYGTAGSAGAIGAVIVGGYSGGVVAPDRLEVAMWNDPLKSVGASLGTKSVQVVPAERCPVEVVASILEFFGGETARQCPPCERGLPDMAAIVRRLERGEAQTGDMDDLSTFMGTLAGRGICRLPDGAARVALALLANFEDHVASHLAGACPLVAVGP
ncbi:MAG TPA: NADH-ubiquinone oxidoreductase-F iron-sulfur binding region domain-containing protein [Acidimicrobiales bacterium]|nr:NADH-ubiquinone oxidoreductase-F iron-sulfur binding region domain-containing protein [Acidimicrobiales bacterium]